MPSIQFCCPYCREALSVTPPTKRGDSEICPACGHSVVVPESASPLTVEQQPSTSFSEPQLFETTPTTRNLLGLSIALLLVLELSLLPWVGLWFAHAGAGASVILNKWTALLVPVLLASWCLLSLAALLLRMPVLARCLKLHRGTMFAWCLCFACFLWPSIDALKSSLSGVTGLYGWVNGNWGQIPAPSATSLRLPMYATAGLAIASFWALFHIDRRKTAMMCAITAFVLGLLLAIAFGPKHP
jgi:hypothetical protein